MRFVAFVVLACIFSSQAALAQMFDPEAYGRAVVEISRTMPSYVMGGKPRYLQGTGWFPDAWHLRTNAHVIKKASLTTSWQKVDLSIYDPSTRSHHPFSRNVRVVEYGRNFVSRDSDLAAGYQFADDTALLLLDGPVPGSWRLSSTTTPLSVGDMLFAIGYPDGELRWAEGQVRKTCTTVGIGCNGGMGIYVSLYNGTNPFVMKEGSSGSPLLTRDGKVAGMIWSISEHFSMTDAPDSYRFYANRVAPSFLPAARVVRQIVTPELQVRR